MVEQNPRISIIIPAYNQARFLNDSVNSALSQNYRNYEIIVVDDGSTDETAAVAAEYGDRIHYVYQENRGLAGARNTGIRHARGEYIALLDSDDIWQPDFLAKMMGLVAEVPDAVVFYCSARCCDVDGHELPQIIECQPVPRDQFYEKLATANFIIPSTVVMLHSAIMSIGLFDQAFRACEDWDLWLRLAPTSHFACLEECLIKYRLHGSSLSADPKKMQQAVRATIEKNFGPEGDDKDNWSRLKKIAYSGVYRYHAWTSVLRQNDWDACAEYVRKAIQTNTNTCDELDFFYDLGLGSQPLGYRGTPSHLDLEYNGEKIKQLLIKVFDGMSPDKKVLRTRTSGTAYFALGIIAYNTGQLALCRSYTLNAIRCRPELWKDPRIRSNFIKSLLGNSILNWIRKIRKNRHESIIFN